MVSEHSGAAPGRAEGRAAAVAPQPRQGSGGPGCRHSLTARVDAAV